MQGKKNWKKKTSKTSKTIPIFNGHEEEEKDEFEGYR
jgi:hypothetical protein